MAAVALSAWVDSQPSVEAIKRHPAVPASLLPELEGYRGRAPDVERQVLPWYPLVLP